MKIGEPQIPSAEEFIRLSKENSLDARHGAASDEVWHDILNRFPVWTEAVIWNKSVPHTILNRLIGSGDPEIRRAVTIKRKLTPHQIERLARDTDPGVRQDIADHPKISDELLNILVEDSNHWVRRRAYQTIQERRKALQRL